MRNSITYRGECLAAGSQAHRLHTEGKMRELDAHLKEVNRKWRERGECPSSQETATAPGEQ